MKNSEQFAARVNELVWLIQRGDAAIPELDRFRQMYLTPKGAKIEREARSTMSEERIRAIATRAVAAGY